MAWRERHRVNQLLDEWQPPAVLQDYFPRGYHGMTRAGMPRECPPPHPPPRGETLSRCGRHRLRLSGVPGVLCQLLYRKCINHEGP